MTRRTAHFEFAHSPDADGSERWWLQMRSSDGRVTPCGHVYRSEDELLAALLDCFDGESFGAESSIVAMPYIPTSAAGFVN